MNYADIKQYDVANGPGVRVSLFVSGCTHQCKGCFNSEAWDFNYGKPFTDETIEKIIEYIKPNYVKGLTILGGEPMEPSNQKGILPLIKRFKEVYPDKNLWIFSGYDFEKDITTRMMDTCPETAEILSYVDVIVDGEFVEALKSQAHRFKGSSNQRTIWVQESLKQGKPVIWDDSIYSYFKSEDDVKITVHSTITPEELEKLKEEHANMPEPEVKENSGCGCNS